MPKSTRWVPQERKVSQIRSDILRPSTTSHYEFKLDLPSELNAHKYLQGELSNSVKQTQLNLMCCEAVLPGSSLATLETNNDYTGVTERHAYRRIYDETIDLSFYVDAERYLPIRFFEAWMSIAVDEDQDDALDKTFNYRVRYPDNYVANFKIVKFEKDFHDDFSEIAPTHKRRIRQGSGASIEYTFVRGWPRSITSMPVSYEGSQLLKCSVQMTYVRYVVHSYTPGPAAAPTPVSPLAQALSNSLPGPTPSPGGGKIASGMKMQRGILGSNIQAALRKQGLPLTTNKVKYWGKGSNMVVEAL